MARQSISLSGTADIAESTSLLSTHEEIATETTALLASGAIETPTGNEFVEQDAISTMAMVKQETQTIAVMSIPVILSYMLQFSFNFINILSIGHLGADELAAAALGNMTVFMLIYAPA
ncbi:hypothetical protein EC988_006539, partial [Linderina pennispora]